MKKLFLIIVCLLMILGACSAELVEPSIPEVTEQVVVTDTPSPTPMATPEPTPLPADALWYVELEELQGEIYCLQRTSYIGDDNDYFAGTVILIEVMAGGTGNLRLALNDLFAEGRVVLEHKECNLSKEQVDELLRLIEETDFWELEDWSRNYLPGDPPEQVYIRGVKDGKFHSVHRELCPTEAILDINGEYHGELHDLTLLESISDIYDLYMYFLKLGSVE